MKILCNIGIHKWREIGVAGFMAHIWLSRCERCGKGKQEDVWGNRIILTAAQLNILAPKKVSDEEG